MHIEREINEREDKKYEILDLPGTEEVKGPLRLL